MAVLLSHVSVGSVLTQTEYEQASAHNLDGDLNLGTNLLVGNAGSTGIAISANGEVNMAAQPAVLAYNSAQDDNVTGNGTTATVDFDTEVFDQNADFASDTFTAPVTGRYLVNASVGLNGITTAADIAHVDIVASNRSGRLYEWNIAGNFVADLIVASGGKIIDMDASDTLTITARVTGEASDVTDIAGGANVSTHISICLLA